MMRRSWLIAALLFIVILPARQSSAYDVFLSSGTATGKASVYFVDARTGLSTVAVTNGLNHTLLGNDVIFMDKDTGRVGSAHRDGTIETQSFIERSEVLTWVVSADRRWIAWAGGHTQAGSLLTDLYVAQADGTGKGIILHTSSSKNIGIRPLAITNDGATVYYTRQADDPKASQPYPLASDVFRLTVSTGESTRLTGEPRCRCAAAFSSSGQTFFRLENTAQGFVAHFIDLTLNADTRADVPNMPNVPNVPYTQAGYALLSDKGGYAVYSMVKSTQTKGTPDQYVLILADASQHKQTVVLNASPNRLRPLAFEQNAILLTGVDKDGTYKLSLTDGALSQVSNYTYLGTLTN